jgi:hypothetical protein
MECPPPQSQLAESARRIVKARHGVDLEHRCDVAKCQFVVCPQRLKRNGRPARLVVCTAGLHVHWCGPGVCQLAVQEADKHAGPWVCPVSRLEVTPQAEVYCPQRVRSRGSQPDAFVHTQSTVRRRPSVKKSKLHETRRNVAVLLTSPAAEALVAEAAVRRERRVSQAVSKAGFQFLEQMRAARSASPRTSLQPVSSATISALASAIDDFLTRVRPRLNICKGNASQVAAVVGFLATGLCSDGVTIFPRLDWVAQRMPAAADLGKLAGFQCRPVSISARHIKAAVFGANGRPISSLLFRWSEPQP